MVGRQHDSSFIGTVPDLYERLMVPMIFSEAAVATAAEIARTEPAVVLETACGTGVLTRALLEACPSARIVATDLNEPMLAVAAAHLDTATDRARVSWQQADAQELAFEDASFDVVACQFGVMFLPRRVRAFEEVRRVLRGGGSFVFTTWDSLATNDFARVANDALVAATPDDALDFMDRTPHGLHDEQQLRTDLATAGFTSVEAHWVEGVSRSTAAEAAVALCQGTPLLGLIARHGSLDVARATQIVEDALLDHFGPGAIEGRIRSVRFTAA